ncbi:glycosyltransferase family 2 protein [Candidatus Dependentiae bacterium]|nr:glycosyltransferase family 2 protein [Candidatus Dependentiae bacterium]
MKNNKKYALLIFLTLVVCINKCVSISNANERPIVIVIPSYNNKDWYSKNLDSVFIQHYSNYRVVYIDDCSNDGTAALVEEYCKQQKQTNKVQIINNKSRQLALKNIYRAIINSDDEEIVVLLDGDDMLAHSEVLSTINAIYSSKDIWLTYGDFKFLSNPSASTWTAEFPAEVINKGNFRNWPAGLTHLRTFYAWLFKQIKIEDLFFEGDFFKMTYDVAIFEPMIEIARHKHVCIKDALYIYNDINSINDHKVNIKLQHFLNRIIRQKTMYKALNESKCNITYDLKEQGKLKADILVFSLNSPDKLFSFINSLYSKVTGFEDVNILYQAQTKEIISKYEKIKNSFPKIKIVKLDSFTGQFQPSIKKCIEKNKTNYLLLTTDDINIVEPINITESIYWLKKTHAHGFYFGVDKSMLDKLKQANSPENSKKETEENPYNLFAVDYPLPINLSINESESRGVYAWQYANFINEGIGKLLNMTLVRKRDLQVLTTIPSVYSIATLEGTWGYSLPQAKVGLFYKTSSINSL